MASPELTRTIELIASSPMPEDADVAAWRAAYNRLGELQFPDASVACEATDAAGVAAEWLIPRNVDDGRTILYLHGGGYVLGGPTTHRSMGTHLATRARGRLLLLDYRLAPEHPFPAAVEDAVTAYEWLVGPYGADPGRVVIAGDSAGGGLTAATLVALRDRGAPLPAGAVCISPWTDLEGTGATAETHAAVDPMVSGADLRRWATAYLAGADPQSPLASPIHADLQGLPPLHRRWRAGGAPRRRAPPSGAGPGSRRGGGARRGAGVHPRLAVLRRTRARGGRGHRPDRRLRRRAHS